MAIVIKRATITPTRAGVVATEIGATPDREIGATPDREIGATPDRMSKLIQATLCAYCAEHISGAEIATSQHPPHVEVCNPCANAEAVESYYASL